MLRTTVLVLAVAMIASACSSDTAERGGYESPERAVVAWFEAVDAGDTPTARRAVDSDSLAVILSIENDLDDETTAAFLDAGVPDDVQATYWDSFALGFSDFASRPISTLTVGESSELTVEGAEYARVPISSGPNASSIVFTRRGDDGLWQVDLVATLSDGFSTLLVDEYEHLGSGDAADAIRAAYAATVVPAFWAAMADGTFGDDFNRVALTLLGEIDS